jgi:pyruvate-ferredoxin/flavodoxin oxidoreductase
MTRRPALFNVYAPCMPEHGIGDDVAEHQSKLALESRAYPIFTYDPDKGVTPLECLNLEGNPSLELDWPRYALKYLDDNGREATMEVPLTFADFAVTEGRFKKHFKKAPRDTWNDSMVQIADFLNLAPAEQAGKFPFVWVVDRKGRLNRVIVAREVAKACEDRRDFWRILKSLSGADRVEQDQAALVHQVQAETVQKLASGLLALVQSGNVGAATGFAAGLVPPPAPVAPASSAESTGSSPGAAPSSAPATNGYVPARLDSGECNACGDCIKINSKIFAYNAKKQAHIVDPKGGPFRDIVKAAEKCTAQCIHPGTPPDPGEKDADKWLKRAAKYNK